MLLTGTYPRDAVVAAVREITKEPIRVVLDAVAAEDTQQLGYEVLASGGTLLNVTLAHYIPEDQQTPDKRIIDIWGNPFLPTRREISTSLYEHITALFSSGELKPNHVEVLPGGLAAIPAGLERLQKNEVSAVKLIVRPAETP
ncbi:hypothetical protein NM688_g6474 [Phlebia brevispora]|uniref:Uncharacterized protein n=1 Tax=Phlebia brevispora TaxID=194682 RepID=A0ACC1SFM8_9APHY|nr:hypothetical protein NM688_g6474 [Phlebia brevispora]